MDAPRKEKPRTVSSTPVILGIVIGIFAFIAGPALAALNFSATSMTGDGAVVIDSSSTISIGTSTATGVTIGNASGTVSFPGNVTVGNGVSVIGSELITNGGFSGGTTGWTLASDVAYGSNNVVCTFVSAGCGITQNSINTVAGNWYRVQFTVSAVTGQGLSISFDHNSALPLQLIAYGAGSWSVSFLADYTGSDTITISDFNDFSGDAWTVTGISMKQSSPGTSSLSVTSPNGPLSLFDDSSYNTAFGDGALHSLVTGNGGANNVAVGAYSLFALTTAFGNTAVGQGALARVTTGNWNTGIGNDAGAIISTGQLNVAIGQDALQLLTTGSNNFGLGSNSLLNLTSGSGNIGIGTNAGRYETGSNTFYLDNQDRGSAAGDKAGALLYGTFNAIPASQTLRVNGRFGELLYTPASSSSTCQAGDFSDDANYHYVCTATNTWKRVALTSF